MLRLSFPHSLLNPGTRFGPYEIVAPLAEGGMGEVYRARDTRLDRTVALKVLPAHLSSDPELRSRFEREARAISSLSHPNICTLYDIGLHEDQIYLVMEYLEGETLADRIQRGPLPLDELFTIGINFADALERAHRAGVIHRDLKPGNIILTRSGAKLLDFGLAKWMPSPNDSLIGKAEDVTQRHGHPLTTEGVVLGTIPYMAPEQLEGKTLDARTDIFAFGAILYEMATGLRAFNAGSNASLIASIMREDPVPPSRLRDITPRALDLVIRTCLAKTPDERYQSAHDLKLALQLLAGGAELEPVKEKPSRSWLVPVVAAALVVALLSLGALVMQRGSSDGDRLYRFTVAPPVGSSFPSLGEGGGLALSPDGRRLVFEATTPEGRTYLWLRALDAEEPEMLEGTEGAEYPFWSPDSHSIAFFADGKLKRIDLPNGPPRTVCDAPAGRGGTWNRRGTIVFAPASKSALFRVAASGGVPQPVTKPTTEMYSHRWPVFVDDNRFLFAVQSQRPAEQGVYAGSLEDGEEMRRVLPSPLSVAYARSGKLYYVREHVLLRQSFDTGELRLTGEPEIITDAMVFFEDRGYVPISGSANGTIAYRRNGASTMRMAWYSRGGERIATVGETGEYEGVSLSPDGTRVAFGYFDAKEAVNHIAIASVKDGVPRRFTFNRGNQYSPIWSPDGQRLAFSDDYAGVDTLSSKSVGGVGEEKPLMPPPPSSVYAQSWSPDGQWVLYRGEDARNRFEVYALPLGGGKPAACLTGPADESQAQFSPDGNWVSYTSTESGRPEVYVQPFPATGAKWQISTGGGDQPRWRRDGKEIYYLAPDRRLMVVPVAVPGAFDVEPPQPLFTTNIPFGDVGFSQSYDVSPDGQRFVIASFDPLSPPTPITVVTGR